MDWRRAKTILIASFLLLNFFLASQVYETLGKQTEYLSNNQISDKQIEELLKTNKIQLAQGAKPEEAAEVVIWKGKMDSKPRSGDFPTSLEVDTKNLEKAVQKIYATDPEKIRFAYKKGETFYFYQMIGKFPIYRNKQEEATMKATLHNGKVKITGDYFLPVEENGKTISIVPVNNAIHLLITKHPGQFKNQRIDSIELGYMPASYNPVYLVPIWRFQIGKKHYYLNAHKSEVSTGVSADDNLLGELK